MKVEYVEVKRSDDLKRFDDSIAEVSGLDATIRFGLLVEYVRLALPRHLLYPISILEQCRVYL